MKSKLLLSLMLAAVFATANAANPMSRVDVSKADANKASAPIIVATEDDEDIWFPSPPIKPGNWWC